MKKMFWTLMVMLLTVSSVSAQQKPLVLGKSHAMQRVEVKNHYLLLPVQEREDNANIRVLVGGQQVQSMNIRLAVDKVDYYVPLDIQRFGTKDLLLDIMFYGDRRFTGAMKDFLCWQEMKQSNTFDTTNREKFRPQYHHTPAYGWMNDPWLSPKIMARPLRNMPATPSSSAKRRTSVTQRLSGTLISKNGTSSLPSDRKCISTLPTT